MYYTVTTPLCNYVSLKTPQNKNDNGKKQPFEVEDVLHFLSKMVFCFHCHVGLPGGGNPRQSAARRVHVIDLSSFSRPVALRTSYLECGFETPVKQWSFNGMILKLERKLQVGSNI